jgi:hypothetical protein
VAEDREIRVVILTIFAETPISMAVMAGMPDFTELEDTV